VLDKQPHLVNAVSYESVFNQVGIPAKNNGFFLDTTLQSDSGGERSGGCRGHPAFQISGVLVSEGFGLLLEPFEARIHPQNFEWNVFEP